MKYNEVLKETLKYSSSSGEFATMKNNIANELIQDRFGDDEDININGVFDEDMKADNLFKDAMKMAGYELGI